MNKVSWIPVFKSKIVTTIVVLLAIHTASYSQNRLPKMVVPIVADQLWCAESAKLGGPLGRKLDASYQNRIMAQDVDRLIAPFRNRIENQLWQSEFWGKWFTSAVQAYRYHPEPELKAVLDKAVSGLINTQTPDGYIGNYSEESRLSQWDIWGQKYCLLGLLAYYDLTQDQKSLKVAVKLTDQLIKKLANKKVLIVETGNYKGMPASSVLEPITQLYVRTNDKRYLEFAEEIVRQWELSVGPQLVSKSGIDVGSRFIPFPLVEEWVKQGQKAYEMMSCYEGLLELYRITGKENYKTAVEKTWQNILDTEIYITGSGSASECWYHGKEKQQPVTMHSQETCVTVTWIKLSQQLLRLTGDPKYADAIEKSYYNALLGSMKTDGSTWGMYSPIMGIRSEGTNQCDMGLNCCVASGPRGLFTLPLTSVMASKDGISVNFFNEGSYQIITPASQVAELIQETDYPVSGKIKMHLNLKNQEQFAISIRIPAWSRQTRLIVNDQTVSTPQAGKYASIARKWKVGDRVELELDMRTRVEKTSGQPTYLAMQRGPIVLARDFRFNAEANVDETITPLLLADGTVATEPIQDIDKPDIWMSFKIPCLVGSWRIGENARPLNLTFCDYSSAGNTFSNASRYRIWFPQLLDITGK